jgi:hypothetical protein
MAVQNCDFQKAKEYLAIERETIAAAKQNLENE